MSGSVSLVNGHIDPDTSRMTDKEIIKALECCISPECENCPYDGDDLLRPCNHNLMKDALDLINRQQAEIKEWKRVVETWQELHEKDKAEIERLTINMNAFGLGMKREKERADTIKSEAIKEFAEKLKKQFKCGDDVSYDEWLVHYEVDNLVKEVVGK